MAILEGFPPIVENHPDLLILGSMPSEVSLQKKQYYGHARNAFWPLMIRMLDADPGLDYAGRQRLLIDRGIALWDVLHSCRRTGSLDANIAPKSIQANDFIWFFSRYERIERVFFNGGMAESLFRKHVLPGLPNRFSQLRYVRLPSTSPANASINFEAKLTAWRAILEPVLK